MLDLRLTLFFPLKPVKATPLPRHQAPLGLGNTMKCVSEWIKLMIDSVMLLFHYDADRHKPKFNKLPLERTNCFLF